MTDEWTKHRGAWAVRRIQARAHLLSPEQQEVLGLLIDAFIVATPAEEDQLRALKAAAPHDLAAIRTRCAAILARHATDPTKETPP